MKSRIKTNDFLENRILTKLQPNKDRSLVAFLVNKADLEKNKYCSSLWIIASDGAKPRRLDIDVEIQGFSWKDNTLVFVVSENGESIFYSYDLDRDTSNKLFSIPMKTGEYVFAVERLFFCSKTSNMERLDSIQQGDELPLFAEGSGVSSNYRNALYSFLPQDGSITRITGDDIDITSLALDETGERLAIISTAMDGYILNESNLYWLDVASGQLELVLPKNSMSVSNVAFLDWNTLVFSASDMKAYGRNQNPELYIYEINEKKLIQLTHELDRSTLGKEIATDSRFSASRDFYVYDKELYFLMTEGEGICLSKTGRDGRLERLTSMHGTGTIDSFAIGGDKIMYTGLRGDSLHELYLLQAGNETKLTDFNEWLDETRMVSTPEPLGYMNDDGIQIDGWVIKPIDYDPCKSYPGVLCIHGGPKMTYSNVYNHLMQLLAAKGCFVFYCNPRGSDGKGNGFADIRGNFGTYAYEDIMGFADKVLETYGGIDRSRLGVMGGSYGGYMTNYIIGQTSRFKAAVSERGISSMVSSFNTSDIGCLYTANYMGGKTPWTDAQAYEKASPLTYADKVSTPTLFIHGKNDGRCNYTESLQMYSAIRYFGVQAKICIFEGESHMLEVKGKPQNKIRRYQEILDWYRRHLDIEE